MSAERVVYSIQRTYILKPVAKPKKDIVTCDQRIDIPTIEPLTQMKDGYDRTPIIVPCIELSGDFLAEFDFTFETNEGVTVLPIKIQPGSDNPRPRYVLVLPRGATGVKSCKITHKMLGEVQHNFTFGIMPPPYNYDNALFGWYVDQRFAHLYIATAKQGFSPYHLPKDLGKQDIFIADGVLFYKAEFNYPLSSESTIHKPKITLHGGGRDFVYTLSLNKTANTVLIDLFTRIITAYDSTNGEIIQQFMINTGYEFKKLIFENFNDIDTPYLTVRLTGARVK